MTSQPELLAPAGSPAALHAAVRAGANAVYLGLDVFNARRGADNFTLATLKDACDYAHLRGVKVYLAFNIVVLPQELDEAFELARQAWRAGIDAFIVQDLGLATELLHVVPGARLHISTQMNTHNADGIRAAAALGAQRVTLARELSLTEIASLSLVAQELGVELEAFAHGALCVCYSGQCFMSSMIGGRSANRGLCAQACRLPYVLHDADEQKELPSPGEHLLSPKDLCSVNLLPQMISAGVNSFKIEGRMKSPDYVYAVTSVYRAVLDRGSAATPAEMQALSEAFSRGFTTAYLEGQRGNDIMSYGRPNNRGVFVGRVARVQNGCAFIASEQELSAGDVLEFWTNKGHFAYSLDVLEIDERGFVVTRPERSVGKGDRVFRVRSAAAVFADNVREPRVSVSGQVDLRIGKPLQLRMWLTDAPRVEACVQGPEIERARTRAVTAQDVRDHIDRMGQSDFALHELEVSLDDGVGIGFSQLHHLRAEVLEQLRLAVLAPWGTRELVKGAPLECLPEAKPHACRIAVMASNPRVAAAALEAGADEVYASALNLASGQASYTGRLAGGGDEAWPESLTVVLPAVAHDAQGSREEAMHFDAWESVDSGQGVLAESLSAIQHACELGVPFEVGPHVPLVNLSALSFAARAGARRVWLSPELNLRQIEHLAQKSPVELGLTIAGRQELMVTEHCLLMSQGPCNEHCAACVRRKTSHYLRDRKGYDFPVVTDCCGRSHLYNSLPLDVVHALPELLHAGVSAFMIDATLMGVDEVREALARVLHARKLANSSGAKLEKLPGTTGGHLFRGVA